MLSEMNQERYKALRLLADHIRTPSRDLSLNAIFNDVKDEDLKWVTEKIHYYLLRLLEESDCEIEEEIELVPLMDLKIHLCKFMQHRVFSKLHNI